MTPPTPEERDHAIRIIRSLGLMDSRRVPAWVDRKYPTQEQVRELIAQHPEVP